jgi:hypothetical protein
MNNLDLTNKYVDFPNQKNEQKNEDLTGETVDLIINNVDFTTHTCGFNMI